MSSLSNQDKVKIEKIFGMETGYVSGYNNRTFQNLLLEMVNIDVYDDEYAAYSSKAKKMRHFMESESDENVGKVLLKMLEEREKVRIGIDNEPDPYESYAKDIRAVATAMVGGQQYASNEERFNADMLTSNAVLADLISVSEALCTNQMYRQDTTENSITDYYRDMLKAKGYEQVLDQTRHGVSATGKDAGAVDLLLGKSGKENAVIEAFKLDSLDQTVIEKHINKAIVNYNALGTPTFLLIYAGAVDFGGLWGKLLLYLKNYEYTLEIKKSMQEAPHPNASTRICDCVLSRDGYDFPVTFLAVNLYKKY